MSTANGGQMVIKKDKEKSIFQRVLRPERGRLVVGGVALLASTFSNAYAPKAMGRLVDALAKRSSNGNDVRRELVCTFAVFSIGAIGSGLRVAMFATAFEHGTSRLRRLLYVAALTRPQSHFESQEECSSDLATTLELDARLAVQARTEQLQDLARCLSSTINGFANLARINARLAVELFCSVPVLALSLRRLSSRVSKLSAVAADAEAAVAARPRERLGSRLVRLCGAERQELEAYSLLCDDAALKGAKRSFARGAFHGTLDAVSKAALVAIVARGGELVNRGELTAGDLLSFTLYAAYASLGLAGLAKWGASQLSAGKRAARKCESLVDAAKTGSDRAAAFLCASTGDDADVINGEGLAFELDDVHFAYGESPMILKGCNLAIKDGETHAIVGASGAGKSTILALLLGVYSPQKGTIRVRQRSLADLSDRELASLRATDVAIVDQQAALFDTTIKQSIEYPLPEGCDIIEAAERAHVAAFVEDLPLKYATRVGKRGCALSGGERARVALARALAKTKARTLLLDEPTAALDAGSEFNALTGALEDAKRRKKTVVVVAHSEAVISRCDTVSVLKAGHIVETGSYAVLRADKASELSKLLQAGVLQ